jgi:polyisoprenyl-teichoic acid--peptidoglycan teichoic acid transferase
MEQTIYRRKSPASLRERVEARRTRKGLGSLFTRANIKKAMKNLNVWLNPTSNRKRRLRPLSVVRRDSLLGLLGLERRSSPVVGGGIPRDVYSWLRSAPVQAARQPWWRSGWEKFQSLDAEVLLPRVMAAFLVLMLAWGFVLHGMIAGTGQAKASLEEPTPAPTAQPVAVKPPAGKTSILVLGSDRRPSDPTFRTDVIVLVTIDSEKGEVSTLSFPRDIVAKVPGYGDDRLNVVMQNGGVELMQDTLSASYGARPPQYYFMTNFDGFVDLINSVGGVEVNAAQPLTDACDLYWSHAGTCEIQPGVHSMDGATALWYIRSRHTSSDFDRLRRAQEVLNGIFARFMTMDALARMPELYAQYHENVETNMDLGTMLALMPTAAKVAQDTDRVHRYAIPEEITADWIMPNGARVVLPNYDAVKEIVKEAGAGE